MLWPGLSTMGFSFQKARCVSDHLAAAQRLAGWQDQWPAMVRAAKGGKGLILLEAEASFAQWGSRSSTWARRGHQPEVPTSGKRKGSKVFGAIAEVSGRLCLQGIEGRLNADSDHAFWPMIMAQTTERLLLIHDGARSHTRAATTACLAAPHDRIPAPPFPSYAPDFHPSEYLWKKTPQRATHKKYCKECIELTGSVDQAWAYCATHPDMGLGLFGRYCEESGLELKQAA
jgi:DDE superfamily endonuclease